MRSAKSIVLLAMPTVLAAQQGDTEPLHRTLYYPSPTHNGHPLPVAEDRTDAAVLWTEDFENGLNGWMVETPYGQVDWQLTSTGNTGGFTPGPLEGTSGYPGGHWIMADSDAQGTSGAPENTRITSPAILGLGAIQYMLLRFEQSFRQLNNDHTLVHVSGNGGGTWTSFEVNEEVPGNQSTPGAPEAQVITLNISNALADGSDDIRIAFEWFSDEGYTYSWQVDEVTLVTAFTNDVSITELNGTEHALNTDHYGMPCTIYPAGETQELRYGCRVINNGGESQTNVRLQVEVSGPGGYTATFNSPAIDLAPAQIDSLFLPGIELPDMVGDYQFEFSLDQDQEDEHPVDNLSVQTIRVDAAVYGRDGLGMRSARDNDGTGYELGNRFWISGYGRLLEGVDVALGPGTEAGAYITAVVYDRWNQYVASSDPYIVAPEDINEPGSSAFITIPFPAPVELAGEEIHLVCVRVQTDEGNTFIGISGTSEPQVSLIRPEGTSTWYYTTSTPMVRMRLQELVGIHDLSSAAGRIQAYPTPFTDQVNVVFTNSSADAVRWELRDATGRLVRMGVPGTLPPGEQRIVVDGADLEAGLYVITVIRGGVRSSVNLLHQARR